MLGQAPGGGSELRSGPLCGAEGNASPLTGGKLPQNQRVRRDSRAEFQNRTLPWKVFGQAWEVTFEASEVDFQAPEVELQARKVFGETRKVTFKGRKVDPEGLKVDLEALAVDPEASGFHPESFSRTFIEFWGRAQFSGKNGWGAGRVGQSPRACPARRYVSAYKAWRRARLGEQT